MKLKADTVAADFLDNSVTVLLRIVMDSLTDIS